MEVYSYCVKILTLNLIKIIYRERYYSRISQVEFKQNKLKKLKEWLGKRKNMKKSK